MSWLRTVRSGKAAKSAFTTAALLKVSKMVFTGDIFQIDHPYLDSQSNGLSYLIEKMRGQRLYSHVTLEKGERAARGARSLPIETGPGYTGRLRREPAREGHPPMPMLNRSALPRLRRGSLLLSLLLSILAFATIAQDAKPPAVTPESVSEAKVLAEIQRLNAKIKEIAAAKSLAEAVRTSALEDYRTAIAQLESAIALDREAAEFLRQSNEAPIEAARIREALAKEPDPAASRVEVPSAADAKTIEQLLARERSRAAELRTLITQLDSQKQAQRGRPTAIQQELAAARKLLEKLSAAAGQAVPAGEDPVLTTSGKTRRDAQKAATLALISKLEQEAASQPVRDDLLAVREQQAAGDLRIAESRRESLRKLLDAQRKADAERAAKEAQNALTNAAGSHPLIVSLVRATQRLGLEQQAVAPKVEDAKRVRVELKALHARVLKKFKSTTAKLGVAGYSREMGAVLNEDLKGLPRLEEAVRRQVEQQASIATVGLRKARLDEELSNLNNLDLVLKEKMSGLEKHDPKLSETERIEIRDQARKLLELKHELTKTLATVYGDYGSVLVEIRTERIAVQDQMDRLEELLSTKLLWMPSGPVVSLDTVRGLGPAMGWITAPEGWAEVQAKLAVRERENRQIAGLLAICALVLLVLRRWLSRALAATAATVGDSERDHIKHTVRALFITILIAMPEPLVLAGLAWLLAGAGGFAGAVGTAAGMLAVSLGMVRFWWVFFAPKGVAVAHYGWSAAAVASFRRNLLIFVPWAMIASVLMWITMEAADRGHFHSLGRLGTLVNAIAMAAFFWRVANPKGAALREAYESHPDTFLARYRHVWFIALTMGPIVLGVLSLLGYQYAAVLFLHRLGRTVGVVLFSLLSYTLLVRWAATNQQRLAFERAAEKAAAGDGPGGAEGRIPVLEASAVDEQSRYLFRVLIGLLTVVGIWMVWAQIIPALSVVDDVVLWSNTATVGAEERVVPFTLGSLMGFVVAVVITVVVVRNIGGLLEIAVLRRMKLDAGARYAVSTLSRYLVTAIGIVVAFQMLGFRWEQIQWLVAAMSVGLGFGLQEIFANFVCGLIIFFERRVRVGDVVTVDVITGTITKIRILATTITDWDRKEFVVPNKEFVAGRLLNWTLSDQVNRMVVEVGVPHGTDTQRVREIMLEAAHKHPAVLSDPGPLATFEKIGDSALMVFLRCYLPDLSNRLSVRSQLHETISAALREEGIAIARPQRDMHIRRGGVDDARNPPDGAAGT